MQLPEGPRQVLAGCLAAAAFLGAYFSLSLVWWLAFVLGLLVFAATLLLVRRKPRADEVRVDGTTTEADIQTAAKLMDRAADRLDAAGEDVPEGDQSAISAMATHVRSIRAQIISDPKDYRRARRFISSYLGHMVDTVEQYADLARKSRGRHSQRLEPLSARIHGFVPALERIDTACLENDFVALESQVDALAMQMKRG